QLVAFRKGSNVDDYVSVYVVAVDCTNSRYTKCSLAVVGDQPNNTFKKEGRMVHFTKKENNWGFDEFIRFNELAHPINGYMVNDACTVEVELSSFSKQDYIKELLPMESGHSGMKFAHEETENGKKLVKENSLAVQRSNWDKSGGVPESSVSRIDGQPIPHVSTAVPVKPKPSPLVSAAVSVTPKTFKESDGYRKYSISEIKERKKRFGMVRLDHDEQWFRTPLRIKGPWVMGWLTSGDPRTSFEKFYPPYEPWTLNMVASGEVTSVTVPDDTDGTDTDGDDPAWTTPLVHLKRKPAPGDQNVEDTSVERSRPDRLDVQSSSKNSEDLEIPNVVDAPFVNSGVLDSEARDEFRSTTMGLAEIEAFFQEFAHESTFSSVAKFVEQCPKLYDLYLLYHNKCKDLEREKDLLVSEVHDLKSRMQGLVTREEADAALAKQIEATNSSVQEHLAIANARIQELESLNRAQSLELATRAERAQEIIKLAEGL
ncbi:hypothetical protein C5167_025360, partial [Papaver somniferum]